MRENRVTHISFGGGLDDIAHHNAARINASNRVGEANRPRTVRAGSRILDKVLNRQLLYNLE